MYLYTICVRKCSLYSISKEKNIDIYFFCFDDWLWFEVLVEVSACTVYSQKNGVSAHPIWPNLIRKSLAYNQNVIICTPQCILWIQNEQLLLSTRQLYWTKQKILRIKIETNEINTMCSNLEWKIFRSHKLTTFFYRN